MGHQKVGSFPIAAWPTTHYKLRSSDQDWIETMQCKNSKEREEKFLRTRCCFSTIVSNNSCAAIFGRMDVKPILSIGLWI